MPCDYHKAVSFPTKRGATITPESLEGGALRGGGSVAALLSEKERDLLELSNASCVSVSAKRTLSLLFII